MIISTLTIKEMTTLKYKGFTGTVEFSAVDMCFHGQVSNISDLVTYEATTAEDFYKGFLDAVDDYIDYCNEMGKEL